MSRATGSSGKTKLKTEYIETDTGNKISRKSRIEGKSNIMLAGKTIIMTGAIVRGDLCKLPESSTDRKASTTAIKIGRGTVISTDCVIEPPARLHKGQMSYYPLQIGDNVFIGPGTQVSALSIGSNVHIGPGSILSPFSIIKDGCKILPGTVVPHSMVVPPGFVVAGNPAQIVGEVGEGWGQGGGVEGEEWLEGGDLKALVRSIK